MATLKSSVEEMHYEEAVELFYQNDWTDGLPVEIPTEGRVTEVLDHLGREPDEVVGVIPPRDGIATVEKIAINSVMAGCRPEYVPVVIAAIEALVDERFNLNGVQSTSNCVWPLTIVNGPVRLAIDMNPAGNLFGGGNRANAAIGRAVRLVLWNVGGGRPPADKATLGHPGKFSYCIPEYEEESPWEPLHVERGFTTGESAVTVVGGEAPHHIAGNGDARTILTPLADSFAALGTNNILFGGTITAVLCPYLAQQIAKDGMSKQDVKQFLFENARRPQKLLKYHGFWKDPHLRELRPHWANHPDGEAMVPVVEHPEDIVVVVAGGFSVPFNAAIPSWGPFGGAAVSRRVKIPL